MNVGGPTPPEFAAFLRDVADVTTKQQSAVEAQTANGFAHWLADIPNRPGIRVPYIEEPGVAPSVLLEVRRPLDPAPKAPRNLQEEELRQLSDHERATYEQEWLSFRHAHASWTAHKDLYDDLFGARTPADDTELVFALGFLVAGSGPDTIRRHLVTSAVEIELDRSAQALRVVVADAPRLELNWTDPATRSSLGDASGPLRDLQDAQCLAEATAAVHGIRASFGIHGDELTTPRDMPAAGRIGLAPLPALLLRKRDSSFLLQLLRNMADEMAAGGDVSEPFQMIVSPTFEPGPKAVQSHRAALPLPCNEEQRVMIDNARREAHLVIQGPPGTGKTHTIANLAAVLMAEGRRVLVTAENERALGEVQAKLPPDMQPLLLPMLKERGTGPLQASVNALSSRASATSTSEARARRQSEALERLEDVEAGIARAEQRLASIAHEDRKERTFGNLTMPVAGHLISLAGCSAQLELADLLLSSDGVLQMHDARDVRELRTAVTQTHRDLAEHRFPEGLTPPPDFAQWLDEHRSQLAVLGDPGEFDYSELAGDVSALTGLAARLQGFPPTAWSALTRTSGEYRRVSEAVAAAGRDLDHSVSFDPPGATQAALALCEEYLALDGTRFDEPLAKLLERHQQAKKHADGSTVLGEFEQPDRSAEVTSWCEEALTTLRRDRSGLLARHVQDYRAHGRSSVDVLVDEAGSLLEGSRDGVGLQVTIEAGAPAFHELARQADGLLDHLESGGKMTGLVKTPRPVREAADLLRFVRVGGSDVDTPEEARRARDHLRFRSQVTQIDSWAAANGLARPSGMPHHDWLTAIIALPAASARVRRACAQSDELVRFPSATAPDDPVDYLAAVLATVSKEIAEDLQALADVAAESPTIRLAGLPINTRSDAERAARAIRAADQRALAHAMLPEAWQPHCNPVDTDERDLLAEMLRACADAAEVPGPARAATLSPSSLNSIAERAQRDRRRTQLLAEHDRVLGALRRTLVGCVPQSPATQAIADAVDREDPIAYRVGVEALAREVEMAEQAHRLAGARAAVGRAHPKLLAAIDLDDDRALEVLGNIGEYERLRDHHRQVRAWIDEIGSAETVHSELSSLYREAGNAERLLASLRCWDKAVERLQARRDLSSALSALAVAMNAVPKTRSAKSYPARIRALREATSRAAPAIPCWVMTIDRVAEVLGYPPREERFDVVIIDEASQAWFPAVFLYAIADQVIVVGDQLQTSPANTAIGDGQLAEIAGQHIAGHRLVNLVGGDLSLYDVATVMTGPDMMVDHFRCVPEIIDISNRLSYAPMGRSLVPARIRKPGALDPVVHVHVPGHRTGSAGANEPEAEAVVAQVVRCHADSGYDGMDFGVVVVGPNPVAHLKLLRTRLLDELGAEAMRERNVEVGTASQFQGAERNVMFLSLVVAPNPGERIRIWPHEHTGKNRRNVQQLNVAVSRARDQLWIFHSFEPGELPPGDARSVVFGTMSVEPASIDEQLESCASQFERDVVIAIAAANENLVVRTQVDALGYAIDIVVEDDAGHRLAVECDGDRWHSSDSQIRSDLYRQRTLENIGWRFYRFLASEWYDDPSRHLQAILDELARSEPARSIQGRPESGDRSVPSPMTDSSADESQFDADDLDGAGLHKVGDDEPGIPVEFSADGSEYRGAHPAPASPSDLGVASPTNDRQEDEPTQQSAQGSLDLGAQADAPARVVMCVSCGRQWTPPSGDSRVPTRCSSCSSSWSPTKVAKATRSRLLANKERNQRLAAALRAQGKERNGAVWARAKALYESGYSIEDAAREA